MCHFYNECYCIHCTVRYCTYMENDQLDTIVENCQLTKNTCNRFCEGCPLLELHVAAQLPKGKERQHRVRVFKDMFRSSLQSVLSGDNSILDVSLVRRDADYCRYVESIPFFHRILDETQRVVDLDRNVDSATSQ